MAFVGSLSLNQAIGASLPYWPITLTNWGNAGSSADPYSIIYPVTLSSNHGVGASMVTIANDSAIDTATLTDENSAAIADISVGAPAIMVSNVHSVIVSAGFGQTPASFLDVYRQDGNPTDQPFGGALSTFELPTLKLLWFIQPTPPILTYFRRAPFIRYNAVIAVADGVEHNVKVWPVSGRNVKSIQVVATGTLVASIRIGVISSFPNAEKTAFIGDVDATTGENFAVTVTAPCAFLAVYYTVTSGAGVLRVKLYATDDVGVNSPGVLV